MMKQIFGILNFKFQIFDAVKVTVDDLTTETEGK